MRLTYVGPLVPELGYFNKKIQFWARGYLLILFLDIDQIVDSRKDTNQHSGRCPLSDSRFSKFVDQHQQSGKPNQQSGSRNNKVGQRINKMGQRINKLDGPESTRGVAPTICIEE